MSMLVGDVIVVDTLVHRVVQTGDKVHQPGTLVQGTFQRFDVDAHGEDVVWVSGVESPPYRWGLSASVMGECGCVVTDGVVYRLAVPEQPIRDIQTYRPCVENH